MHGFEDSSQVKTNKLKKKKFVLPHMNAGIAHNKIKRQTNKPIRKETFYCVILYMELGIPYRWTKKQTHCQINQITLFHSTYVWTFFPKLTVNEEKQTGSHLVWHIGLGIGLGEKLWIKKEVFCLNTWFWDSSQLDEKNLY